MRIKRNMIEISVCDANGQPRRVYPAEATTIDGAKDEARALACVGYIGGDARVIVDGNTVARYARTPDGIEELMG